MPDGQAKPINLRADGDGARIRQRRLAAVMSLRQLADAAGIAVSAVRNVENGEPTEPEHFAAIEAALNEAESKWRDHVGKDDGSYTLGNRAARLPPPAEPTAAPSTAMTTIPHNRIRRSNLNPRRTFGAEALADLAESIATDGVLENLLVRADPANPGDWLVVAGERRWRAVGLLVEQGRLPTDTPLPVRVVEADEVRHRLLAIVENLQREDVAPLDEARAFLALVAEEGWTPARIAKAIGKTDRHVQLRLALLTRLHQDIQDALDEGRCNLAVARALTAAPLALQPQLLAMMEGDDPPHHIRTADDLADYIRAGLRTADQALFSPEDYTAAGGERFDDPESGRTYLLDGDLFARLQHTAIDALEDSLKTRYAWVERTNDLLWTPSARTGVFYAADHPGADLPVGAVIHIGLRDALTIFENLVRPAANGDHNSDDNYWPTNANCGGVITGIRPKGPTMDADPVAAVSPERRAFALKAKTLALQTAMLPHPDAPHPNTWMHQLALALMGCRDVADILAPPPMPQNATVAPPVLAILLKFRALLGEAWFLPIGEDWPYLTLTKIGDDPYTASVTDAAIAVMFKLQDLTQDALTELLSALTASRCATRFLPARSNFGDNPLVLATADTLGAHGVLDKMASEIPWPNGVRPPELRFATRAEIEAALRAAPGA